MKSGGARAGSFEEFRTGWTLLVAAMLGCALGVSSLPLYTAGVFFPALEAEFGWSRTQLSSAIFIFTLSLAAASPVIGRIVDHIGVRRAAACSIIAASACYLLLSQVLANLHTFYALHILIAGLGAAAAPVAYTRVVTSHFTHNRGLALGITLLGPSLVAATGPALLAHTIAAAGWRGGYILLAGLTAAVLPFLFLLNQKVSVGSKPEAENGRGDASLFDANERREIFIVLIAALGLFSVGIGGLIVHLVPMLTDGGMDPVQGASVAGLIGLTGIAGRIVGGALADRIFAPYILVGVALAACAGCASLAVAGIAMAVPAAMAIGFSLGTEADLMGYLVSRYFGQSLYGRIFGWQYAVFISGVGLSPVLLGYSYDFFGNYVVALSVSSALLLLAAGLFGRLPKFREAAA